MSLFKWKLKVFKFELFILSNAFNELSYISRFGKIIALQLYMIQLMNMIQKIISLFLLPPFKSIPVLIMVRVNDQSLYHFTSSSLRGLDRCFKIERRPDNPFGKCEIWWWSQCQWFWVCKIHSFFSYLYDTFSIWIRSLPNKFFYIIHVNLIFNLFIYHIK